MEEYADAQAARDLADFFTLISENLERAFHHTLQFRILWQITDMKCLAVVKRHEYFYSFMVILVLRLRYEDSIRISAGY